MWGDGVFSTTDASAVRVGRSRFGEGTFGNVLETRTFGATGRGLATSLDGTTARGWPVPDTLRPIAIRSPRARLNPSRTGPGGIPPNGSDPKSGVGAGRRDSRICLASAGQSEGAS